MGSLRRRAVNDPTTRFNRRALTVAAVCGVFFTFPFCSQIEGLGNRPAPQTVAAETFAQGMLDTLIGNLKQEIAQGSTATAAGNSTIYQPLVPANMLPVRSGNPAPSGSPAVDSIPNLIRRSVRADAIVAPGVPSLASAVNSADDASLNGSTVVPARWNLHYLIPRFDADGTGGAAATTPDAATQFTAPDWVLVSRSGPAVRTEIGNGVAALNNPDPANTNYVVGRYAFAMYDEGGLLDINAAGHPTPATPPAATGLTAIQVGYKGLPALADLTQLPLARQPAASSDYLSQASIDHLVGWRNYASAQPSGMFPNFSFDAAASARWYNAALANRNGFLAVDPAVQFNGQTDQRFTSRQQLIGLCDALGISRNALQYLTTFSRALEQPSFVPAHVQFPNAAPSINNVASTAPPAAKAVDSYLGNNDAAGTTGSVSNQDAINPALLGVRVQAAFTRQDGSAAMTGEPLVKKKFALSRLGEINFSATDSTPSITDPATSQNHIKDWFGLSRASASSPWTYNHGATHIMTLDEVAAANREPDFAELLKASINVGSLAKGGPNLHNTQGNYQYTLDTSVDYQVFQIVANLIDQSDADSFPTVIQMTNGSGTIWTVRGVEDLPYFYRYHQMSVVTRLPLPLLAKSNQVVWKNGSSTIATTYPCEPLPANGLQDAGKAALLYVPEVWNPHDASTLTMDSRSQRPMRFRVVAITDDPNGATPSWQTGATPGFSGSYYDAIPSYSVSLLTKSALLDGTTSFTFSDDGGKLFREPTLLCRADAPTNANIAADASSLAGPYVDANTSVSYFGIQIGQSPVSIVASASSSQFTATPQSPTNQYIFQAGTLQWSQVVPAGAYPQFTFRLQYQDPNGSGNWITYDEKYPDSHGQFPPNLIVNKADYTNNSWMNVLTSGQVSPDTGWLGYDPRSARFGTGTAGNLSRSGVPVLEPAAASAYGINTTGANAAFASSKFTIFVTDRPGSDRGNYPNYSLPGMTSDPGKNVQMRWFSGIGFSATNGQDTSPVFYDGLLTQNDSAVSILARNSSTTTHVYYEDPDGIARRAMGAYALTGMLPTSKSTAAAQNLEGLPEATADTYPGGSYGVGVPTAQSQSRPLMLNRPFHSVAEMSYAFTGTTWKQLDFFTPESGDSALLDTFCLTEPPTTALVGGKVNLNTRQAPVLQAILAGAYRDEIRNLATAPSYALPALNAAEAANVASKLVGITTDATAAWRGPLTNVADLVGHFVAAPGNTTGATDLYQFTETVTGANYTYAGFSAALDGTAYTASPTLTPRIQRLRESAIRPLADCGQTRVWNILIDLVTQTGNYPEDATTLSQFRVTEENHCWLHVALDRFTGEVLDQSIEPVYEGITDLGLSNATVLENRSAGAIVGAILPTGPSANEAITYSLVAGAGGDDNASFSLSGGTLQTAATFQYLSRSSYSVRVRAINAYGQGFEKAFAVTVLPTNYTQWKLANFGDSANDPATAGDTVDPDGDGLSNLVEYALGTPPTHENASGVSARTADGTLTMNYTRSATATDVVAHAYWSHDLADPNAWTRTGVTETMISSDNKVQQWQATGSTSAGQPAFMRLQITRP